jgi:p-aminobenzoyl-glutamate transporter AbgT
VIVGVAMGVEDIQAVFNVVGAICSSSTGVLLPVFLYVRLVVVKKQRKTWKYFIGTAVLAVLIPYCLFSVAALYIQP